LSDSPGQFQQLSVSTDGKFNSAKMAPGSYRVMAFKNPQLLPYRDPEAMRAYETTGQIVHLAAGQQENVQLQITSSSD
jgi:sucrose-6-phosphate hydrolase SacC (GH32 family)